MKAFVPFLMLTFILFSCADNGEYGIFTVLEDEQTIEMSGTIGSSSLDDFNDLLLAFPEVKNIDIVNCDGSSDDEVNLLLSAKVYNEEMSIHLLDDSEIASGGVDFFLAGKQRTQGNNTKIGVHAWADISSTATDYPVGDPVHQAYIDYYISIGFSQQQAEDFYYFTINAAPASSIHWMSDSEIALYGILAP